MDIKYLIVVDSKTAQASVEKFDGAVKDVAKTTRQQATPAVGGLQRAWANLTSAIAVGMIAYQTAGRVVHALTGFVKSTVTAAIEAEEAENNLRLSLETTGREVESSLRHYSSYASSLMDITRYDDETIKSTQALLLQLTDLNQDGLDEATRGAIGLASVFKIDLDTAARIVAKATEGNVEMLGRYIPKLKGAKTEGEKAAIMQRELAKMFERAEGQMNTYAGRVDTLKKNYNELKETFGKTITESKGVNDALFLMNKLVKDLNKSLKERDGKPRWIDFIGPVAALKGISGAVSSIADKIRESEKPLYTVTEYTKAWNAAWGEFQAKAPGVATTLTNLFRATDDAGRGFGDFNDKIKTSITIMPREVALARDLTDAMTMLAISIKGELLPAARDMRGVIEQAPASLRSWTEGLDYVAETTKETTKSISNYFDGLYNDIAQGFARVIEDWLAGAKTFEDFMTGLWDNIKSAFFRMVGEMVADKVLGLFKSLFSKIADMFTNTLTSAGNQAVKAVTGITQGASGVISGLWTGLGAAVGSFLGTALAGKGLGETEGHWIHEIRDKAFEIQQDLHWVLLNVDNIKKSIGWSFGGRMIKLASSSDKYLKAIASNTAILKNIQFGQHGLDTVVNRPTMFVAGERGTRERVSILPTFKFSAAPIIINLDGRQVAQAVARYSPQMTRDGVWRVHNNALITR